MSDPLSAAGSIAGIVALSGQVLVKLTEYISDIQQAPKHVEQLANELMATTTSLQRFKLLVMDRQGSNGEELKTWAADSQTMLQNCEETFKQIDDAVTKAQIKSKGTVKGDIVSRVRWVWNKNETELLKVRLKGYEAAIQLMLQTLSSKQIDNIDQTTQKLHELVKSIQNERANIKERLLVLDKDHPRFSSPDGVISWRESADSEKPNILPPSNSQPLEGPQGGEGSSENDWEDCDDDDVDIWSSFNEDTITQSSWPSAHIETIELSRGTEPIKLCYQPISIKVVIACGISPMLEIELNEFAITQISKFLKACSNNKVTYTYDSVETKRETHYIPRTTTSTSSRPDPTKPMQWNVTKSLAKEYDKASVWGKIAMSPNFITTSLIDIALDSREETVTRQTQTEQTTFEVEVPYTVQRTATRKAPLVQPPHLLNFQSGKIWYPLSFAQIKRASFTSLILSPNPVAHSFRRDEGALEIRCSHKAIADEMEKNLSNIIGFARFAWVGHCEAFALMDPKRYECKDPKERDKLAMDEEFKWVTFASAFAKVSESS